MKLTRPAEGADEFGPTQTNVPSIQICEHFPLMARMDKVALIRSLYTQDRRDEQPAAG